MGTAESTNALYDQNSNANANNMNEFDDMGHKEPIRFRVDASVIGEPGILYRIRPIMHYVSPCSHWPHNGQIIEGYQSDQHPGWIYIECHATTGTAMKHNSSSSISTTAMMNSRHTSPHFHWLPERQSSFVLLHVHELPPLSVLIPMISKANVATTNTNMNANANANANTDLNLNTNSIIAELEPEPSVVSQQSQQSQPAQKSRHARRESQLHRYSRRQSQQSHQQSQSHEQSHSITNTNDAETKLLAELMNTDIDLTIDTEASALSNGNIDINMMDSSDILVVDNDKHDEEDEPPNTNLNTHNSSSSARTATFSVTPSLFELSKYKSTSL